MPYFIRFLNYVRPYWKYILLAVIGGIGKFTVPLLAPQVTRHLLDHVFANGALSTSQKLHEMYWYLGGMIALFFFVWTPLTYIRHYFAPRAGQHAVFDLRCDLYQRILRMSSSFFDANKTGSILSRLTSDVSLAQNLVGDALTNIWMDAAAVFVVLYFMFRIDMATTLVALATLPFYGYFFRKYGNRIKASTRSVQDEMAAMSGNAQEKLSGSLVVRAFAQEDTEVSRFLQDSQRLFDVSLVRVLWQSRNTTTIGLITHIAPIIVMLYTGYRVITGYGTSNPAVTIGEFIAIGMYLDPLYLPMRRFSELNIIVANGVGALERIFEFMDEEPEIKDLPSAVSADNIRGEIEFRHVTFAYPQATTFDNPKRVTNLKSGKSGGDSWPQAYGTSYSARRITGGENPKHENRKPGSSDSDSPLRPVLHDISCTILPGQNVALVGPSGSGKSTFVSLIPRFYDVTSGEIRVDNHPISQYQIRSLRRQIGMVLQDPILFSGSIRENILYGSPEADELEIVRACDAANALDFILDLPEDFETPVGERGILLSGGQKQRLTIARAFLANPRILILDEATSSLDSESERLIQEALARLIKGRTTFTIAHRLSTIIGADKILVLHEGRIVESGTHAELLADSQIYRNLYDQQFRHTLSA